MSSGLSRVFVLLWVFAGITAGCGLKGDLYLPETETLTAAAEDDEEDKESSQQTRATDSETPAPAP